MSTFHGLEMAKRALSAQQSALYTTGHNISNAHTEGYSRQRVNFETDIPYPSASRNKPAIPGQMGTGVKIGSVERIRDQYLDIQFRSEYSRASYWNTQKSTLSRVEDLLNEPSDSGLSKTMKQFWQSLQDLAVNPENSGARSVVKERAVAVADTFNYLSSTLESVRTDLKSEIDITQNRVNTLLNDINDINIQVKRLEPHGYLTNDLYDERDRLIDELASIVNIKVHKDPSGGGALPTADGTVSIELVNNKGESIGDGVFLIERKGDKTDFDLTKAVNEIEINFNNDNHIAVEGVYSTKTVSFEDLKEIGSLMGLIDSYGYGDPIGPKMSVPHLIKELDEMASAFVTEFNRVHGQGFDLAGVQGIEFFEIVDGSIQVNKDIIDDPNKIAASTIAGEDGNGHHALELAKVFETALNGENDVTDALGGKSVNDFLQSLIGELGVAAEESIRRTDNAAILLSQVENQRMSVSAVSLDEEMTNMIKFQHAYNAAARSMTSMDEMLDRIINSMGLVGR